MISAIVRCQFHLVVKPNLYAIRSYTGMPTRNPADADDLLQDTLLRACLRLHPWRPGINMMGWLIVIMRRIFLTHPMRTVPAKPKTIPLDDRDLGIQPHRTMRWSSESSRRHTDRARSGQRTSDRPLRGMGADQSNVR